MQGLTMVMLGEKRRSASEVLRGKHGPATTAAVLCYRTKRRIINFAYQTKPDDIVGLSVERNC